MSGSLKEQVERQDWRRKKVKMDVERREGWQNFEGGGRENEIFLGFMFFYFDF